MLLRLFGGGGGNSRKHVQASLMNACGFVPVRSREGARAHNPRAASAVAETAAGSAPDSCTPLHMSDSHHAKSQGGGAMELD